MINSVDLFVFYDDVQYTRKNWRNRNKIKTPYGLKWLSIPCGSDEDRLICDVALNSDDWQWEHWNKIELNYRDSKYFHKYADAFKEFYLQKKWTSLSELNQSLTKYIASDILGSKTVFGDSRQYALEGKKAKRVVELCMKAGATSYLCGPAAKTYLSADDFAGTGIHLEWMDYSNYPEYSQLYPPFEHEVSIIDLIFNMGPDARRYMKSFPESIAAPSPSEAYAKLTG